MSAREKYILSSRWTWRFVLDNTSIVLHGRVLFGFTKAYCLGKEDFYEEPRIPASASGQAMTEYAKIIEPVAEPEVVSYMERIKEGAISANLLIY